MKKGMSILVLVIAAIIVLLVVGKKSLYTEVIINAPAEKVWKEFTNFSEYPNWNPFLRKVSGDMKSGNSINVTIQPKNHEPVDFNPAIIIYEEKRTVQWEGKLFIPGLFTGRHTFQLINIDKDKTRFIQKEDFNGILVPFISLDATLEGFKEMNGLLKSRIEKR
jgi:hypothetical protein